MLDPKKLKKLNTDLQSGMETVKRQLADERIEGAAGGGALRVFVNGNQEVLEVKVSPEAVDPDDVQMLEDLFKAAANQALDKARELQQERIGGLTGGMKLPNMPFF